MLCRGARSVELPGQGFLEVEHLPCGPEHCLAGVGRRDRAVPADQDSAGRVLQRSNPLGHRGLREVEVAGGRVERTEVDDGHEGAQLVQVKCIHK